MTDAGQDADAESWAVFAAGTVVCPQCGRLVPIPVLARPTGDPEKPLELQPELSDLWLHSWTHLTAGSLGREP